MYVNQVLVASQMARAGASAWKQHRCWPFVETTSGPRMRGPQFLLLSFAWCGPFGIGPPLLPDADQNVRPGTHANRLSTTFPVYRSCPLGIYDVCKSSSGCLPNGAGRGLGLETTQMLAFRRDNIGAADARPPVSCSKASLGAGHSASGSHGCPDADQKVGCARKPAEYDVSRIVRSPPVGNTIGAVVRKLRPHAWFS